MIGIVLALLSATLAGLSAVLVRKVSRESSTLNISLAITMVGTIVLWPLAILFTDLSNLNFESVLLFALAGAFAPCMGRLFYYKGVQTVGASVNGSIYGTYPMYVSLFSVLLLGENLSLINWFGILCIVSAVILIQSSSLNSLGQKRIFGKNLLFPVLGALSFAAAYIVRKSALNLYNAPMLGAALGYTLSLVFYLIITISETHRHFLPLRRDLRLFWKAGFAVVVSWILSFYALSYEKASVTTPIQASESLFIVFFSYLYLRGLERQSYRLILGILLTVLGIVLITLTSSS